MRCQGHKSDLSSNVSMFFIPILGYFPREKPGSCPPAKYPEDYYDDYYTRNINPYRSGNLKIDTRFKLP